MHFIPDGTKAVPYDQLTEQPDHWEACSNYIAKHFGADVSLALPRCYVTLWEMALSGYTEDMALLSLTSGLGLPLIQEKE